MEELFNLFIYLFILGAGGRFLCDFTGKSLNGLLGVWIMVIFLLIELVEGFIDEA